jgi:hypothetical protein
MDNSFTNNNNNNNPSSSSPSTTSPLNNLSSLSIHELKTLIQNKGGIIPTGALEKQDLIAIAQNLLIITTNTTNNNPFTPIFASYPRNNTNNNTTNINFTQDLEQLTSQPLSSLPTVGVCGYAFKVGDLVWNCKQCQADPTSCQCQACFSNSDHTGHDVSFHQTNMPGGCCDGGDDDNC